MRVVVAAGGTAGHVVPALAVAAELRKQGVEVHFLGGNRAERELVPAAGFSLTELSVEGVSRRNPLKAARAIVKAFIAVFAAFRWLLKLKPQAVVGGGGYVAGPVGLAAAVLRIPLVLTEADRHLGITNRLLSPFARRVCLAFPLPGREAPHYLVTGRPLPLDSFRVDRAAARAELGIAEGELMTLVFGGSLGARSINLAAIEAFSSDCGYRVVHVSGRRDYPSLTAPGPHYQLIDYLSTDAFARVLAAADVVVGRSGGSVFELAALGKPAVLIPYPHASADHQQLNADWLVDGGAAVCIADGQLTAEGLREQVDRLVADPARLAGMSAAALSLARPDAAIDIAAEVVAAVS